MLLQEVITWCGARMGNGICYEWSCKHTRCWSL